MSLRWVSLVVRRWIHQCFFSRKALAEFVVHNVATGKGTQRMHIQCLQGDVLTDLQLPTEPSSSCAGRASRDESRDWVKPIMPMVPIRPIVRVLCA